MRAVHTAIAGCNYDLKQIFFSHSVIQPVICKLCSKDIFYLTLNGVHHENCFNMAMRSETAN